jgi:hypothetical protein
MAAKKSPKHISHEETIFVWSAIGFATLGVIGYAIYKSSGAGATSTTAGTSAAGNALNLTPQQQADAASIGLSPQEYANMVNYG